MCAKPAYPASGGTSIPAGWAGRLAEVPGIVAPSSSIQPNGHHRGAYHAGMLQPTQPAPPPPLLRYSMLSAGLLFGLGFWIAGAVVTLLVLGLLDALLGNHVSFP